MVMEDGKLSIEIFGDDWASPILTMKSEISMWDMLRPSHDLRTPGFAHRRKPV